SPLAGEVAAIQFKPIFYVVCRLGIEAYGHRTVVIELGRMDYLTLPTRKYDSGIIVVVLEICGLKVWIEPPMIVEGRPQRHETSKVRAVGDLRGIDLRAIVVADSRPQVTTMTLAECH